jgi:N-acetylglucosaminyldiphosphoundecaprenol N-acetyl-beta-D-mannosaminyltransferase
VSRQLLFGITIDNLTNEEAVEAVRRLLDARNGQHYVVTPNVDHVVRLEADAAFRQAYAGASLVLADGMPLVWASRVLGRPLKDRVTGADLLPRACAMAAAHGRSVFLLGGRDGVAELAARNLAARYPGLRIAGTYSPPLGFERDAAENRRIAALVNRARPDLLAIGLGAPKQELWIAQHRRSLDFGVALCVGAALDFAAGTLPRAPRWLRESGFEWAWRLAREPRRLWKRYLVDDMAFGRIVLREWRRIRLLHA